MDFTVFIWFREYRRRRLLQWSDVLKYNNNVITLYGNFDTILAADNEDVVIVDAEFHVNNQRGDIYET